LKQSLNDFGDSYESLVEGHGRLRARAELLFSLERRMPAVAGAGSQHDADYQAQEGRDFDAESNRLITSAYDLISRGVLRCWHTEAGRQRAIREVGLVIAEPVQQPAGRAMDLEPVVLLGTAILLVLLLFFLTFGASLTRGGSNPGSPKRLLLIPLMIGTTYSIAISCAVYVTHSRGGRRPDGSHRAAFYLLAGAAAALGGWIVDLLIQWVLGGYLRLAWTNPEPRWAWQFVTFFTAAGTAFLLERSGDHWRWWVKGVIQGSLTALAAAFTSLVLYRITTTYLGMVEALPTDQRPDLTPFMPALSAIRDGGLRRWGTVVAINGVIGFLIGAVLPRWYRLTLGMVPDDGEDLGLLRAERRRRPNALARKLASSWRNLATEDLLGLTNLTGVDEPADRAQPHDRQRRRRQPTLCPTCYCRSSSPGLRERPCPSRMPPRRRRQWRPHPGPRPRQCRAAE
jgi:hypothetical protein